MCVCVCLCVCVCVCVCNSTCCTSTPSVASRLLADLSNSSASAGRAHVT